MLVPAHVLLSAAPRRRGRQRAFALVVTLLILSLLIVVAVSYLTSMSNERQTADAYTSKARAEQVAQAGVDSAMAILTESFRDFPDSATVWDQQQSVNSDGSYNEGTSFYLRAVPTQAALSTGASSGSTTVVANPQPNNATASANAIDGNNPNNPACKNFVLPLISGVPGGRAQLVSAKSAMLQSMLMNLKETDPAKQNFADLNVRRSSGDTKGVIGSPPDWPTNGSPKPARALWVNLKGSDGLPTGRYAFWIEDESFRTNVNAVNFDNSNAPTNPDSPQRADNSQDGKSVVDPATNLARSVQPKDMFLSGALAGFPTIFDPSANTRNVLDTRGAFPGGFLPEPLAFTQVANTTDSTMATPVTEGLRYLTTTQSSSLNLTRHGTQRLNLNATTTINPNLPVTMAEIRKLVETIRFHLPNFGQRFYRTVNPDTATTNKSGILNKPTDVTPTNAEMYLYKTAANLRDYIDTDDQPTMIVHPTTSNLPTLWVPGTPVYHPFGGDGQGGNGPNYMWAQGKDGAPFLQEAMVRYRPAIQNSGANYTLTVDYYVEFWNMSDHDVTAAQLGHKPFVRISTQQGWYSAYIPATNGKPTPGAAPVRNSALGLGPGDNGVAPNEGPARDFNMDLINGVYRADDPTNPIPVSTGVLFKAGTATVITSDPDFVAYPGHSAPVTASVYAYGGQALGPKGLITQNVYYCSNTSQGVPPSNPPIPARRTFSGPTGLDYRPGYLRGIMPHFNPLENSPSTYLDFEVETTLGNDLGYIDCATGAFCISAGKSDGGSTSTSGYDFTWTTGGDVHNDYLHGGTLGGNGNTVSETGDPRTNNEQLYITLYRGTSFPSEPDQYRYGSPGQNLMPPFSLGSPNSQYVRPANGTSPYTLWPDYYDWPNGNAYPTTTPITAANCPSVIADAPLTSIGQLGDLFDPARLIGTVGTASIDDSRGGGRTLKIGQRDDRFMYDPSGNPAPNNTADNVPASSGWAAWRLTDVFSISDPLELPARININGVNRDNGAALRAALTGFSFQPQTSVDPLIHGTANLAAAAPLKTLPNPDSTKPTTGVPKLISDIQTRLAQSAPNGNAPCGPFFERGELGELESSSGVALFGKNLLSPYITSPDLAETPSGGVVDLNHTFDRGREELFRRLTELTCTRGDTFTVYAVGQSLTQTDSTKPVKITGTHRMRVTFRLVPKQYTDTARTTVSDFHPGNVVNSDGSLGSGPDFDPETATGKNGLNTRFAKPDLYDIQVLEVNTL